MHSNLTPLECLQKVRAKVCSCCLPLLSVYEGLAMACSQTGTDFDPFLPRDLFTEDSITTKLSSTLTLDTELSGSHTLDIIAETLQDSDLAPGNASSIPSNDLSFPLE